MKKALEQKIRTEFEELFRREDGERLRRVDSRMECGDGWYDIIYDLTKKLSEIGKASGASIRVVQVKEKFGTLRYYYTLDGKYEWPVDLIFPGGRLSWVEKEKRQPRDVREIIDAEIREAYAKSEVTCEECGQPGVLRTEWYHLTLCDKCFEERKQADIEKYGEDIGPREEPV